MRLLLGVEPTPERDVSGLWRPWHCRTAVTESFDLADVKEATVNCVNGCASLSSGDVNIALSLQNYYISNI
jgi:hypothetical protein